MKPTRRGFAGIVAGLFAGGAAKAVAKSGPIKFPVPDVLSTPDPRGRVVDVFTAPHDGYYVFSSGPSRLVCSNFEWPDLQKQRETDEEIETTIISFGPHKRRDGTFPLTRGQRRQDAKTGRKRKVKHHE